MILRIQGRVDKWQHHI